jgi:glutamate-1-semialdehyde 2,1-aminomutase
MLTAFFTEQEVRDLASAKTADTPRYARFFHAMLGRGFFFAPSQFEAAFCSLAHTEADLDATVEAAREAFSFLS